MARSTKKSRGLALLRILAAMFALMLLVAACGDDGGEDGDDAADDAGDDAGDDDAGDDDAADDDAGDDDMADEEAQLPDSEITLLIPYDAGGGGDAYARGIAEVMSGMLGVDVVPENRPPAAEALSALWNAEPDGTTFGYIPMPATIGGEILQPEISDWTTEEFGVLGIVESNSYVVYVAADSEFETIEDLQAKEGLVTLSTNPGAGADLAGQTAIVGLGLDATTTYGAETSGEMHTALLRGDIDFTAHGVRDFPGAVENGELRPLLFLGTDEQKEGEGELVDWLDDVPTWDDFGKPELAGAVTEHRAFAVPPGMDPALFQAMQDLFTEVIESEELADWSESTGRLLIPTLGEDAAETVINQAEAMRELVPQLPNQ